MSTAVLQRQLESSDSKIIITTIQKLSNFVKRNNKHDLYNENVVMIFDECHRSQFGEMHQMITKAFKNILYLDLQEHQYLQQHQLMQRKDITQSLELNKNNYCQIKE